MSNDDPSTSPSGDATATPLDKMSQQAFNIWIEHEKVAMHFNDLLMRWRLQAISGLAALVTLGGWAVGNVANPDQRYWGMLLLAVTFLCVWIGLAALDLFYYRQLLAGAVKEILDVEAVLPIKLSTRIEELAEKGGRYGPWSFYVAGLVPIVVILVYSVVRIVNPPPLSTVSDSRSNARNDLAETCPCGDQDGRAPIAL